MRKLVKAIFYVGLVATIIHLLRYGISGGPIAEPLSVSVATMVAGIGLEIFWKE